MSIKYNNAKIINQPCKLFGFAGLFIFKAQKTHTYMGII